MIECSIFFEVIREIYRFFQDLNHDEQHQELREYIIESKESMTEIQRYMKMTEDTLVLAVANDLRARNKTDLRNLVHQLIHINELHLAEIVNSLIEEDCRLPPSSFDILKGYFGR